MPTWQRTYLVACAGVIGYALAYCLSHFGAWPMLTYQPYEREWRLLAELPDPAASNYLGLVAWGLAGAIAAALIVWIATAFIKRDVSKRWLHLFGGWALTAFAFAGLYFTWGLWPF